MTQMIELGQAHLTSEPARFGLTCGIGNLAESFSTRTSHFTAQHQTREASKWLDWRMRALTIDAKSLDHGSFIHDRLMYFLVMLATDWPNFY